MKALTLAFQGGAIAVAIGIASCIGHKAASDYCANTEPPNPFEMKNIATNKAEKYRRFCAMTGRLSPYNPLYSHEQVDAQNPPQRTHMPGVTKSPYSIDPYLGIPGS